MKVFLKFLMLGVFTFSSVELVFDVHYCHGQVKSIEIFPIDNDSCCGNNANGKSSCKCCKDERIYLEIENEEYKNSDIRTFRFGGAENILFAKIFLDFFEIEVEKLNLNFVNSPPPSKQPLWLLHSNFTFYG